MIASRPPDDCKRLQIGITPGLPAERNGYVFHEPDHPGLESAMHRAIGLWYSYPEDFRRLTISGMRYDYSWNQPVS